MAFAHKEIALTSTLLVASITAPASASDEWSAFGTGWQRFDHRVDRHPRCSNRAQLVWNQNLEPLWYELGDFSFEMTYLHNDSETDVRGPG